MLAVGIFYLCILTSCAEEAITDLVAPTVQVKLCGTLLNHAKIPQ